MTNNPYGEAPAPGGPSPEPPRQVRGWVVAIGIVLGLVVTVVWLTTVFAVAYGFTAETGRTPMRALREARMRHAATLLDATDLDIGQVAAASGFVSPFHFSRAYRRAYGLPPRDYRAR